jgi:isoleucyl-tRNA synthetase
LNVREVGFLSSAEEIVTLVAKPNYRSLGSRFGKQTNDAANAIRALSQEDVGRYQEGEAVQIEVGGESHPLVGGDVDVLQEASGELVVKGEGLFTVALDPELDDELLAEGLARELVNRIQRLRKDVGLEITDRIDLAIGGGDPVQSAAGAHEEFIGGETLALSVTIGADVRGVDYPHVLDVDLDGTAAQIGLRPSVA